MNRNRVSLVASSFAKVAIIVAMLMVVVILPQPQESEGWWDTRFQTLKAETAKRAGVDPSACSYGRWQGEHFLAVFDESAITIVGVGSDGQKTIAKIPVAGKKDGMELAVLFERNKQAIMKDGRMVFQTMDGWKTWR